MKRSSYLALWALIFTGLAVALICLGKPDVWSACAIVLAAVNHASSIILREIGR